MPRPDVSENTFGTAWSPSDLLERTARREQAVIFVAALIARWMWWDEVGTSVVRDATRYIAWCQDLSAGTLFGSRAIAYAGYWLPYCGWLEATDYYVEGWVAVQVVLSALTCVVVYEAARTLVGRQAALVAGGAFVFQWQVYRWVARPQSEFVLTFLLAVAVWRLGRYHTDPSRRNRLFALVSLGFVATARPNGLPIVLGYLVYDCFPASSGRRLNLFASARANLALAGVVVAGVVYRLQFGWAMGSVLTPWKRGIVITPERFVYQYSPTEPGSMIGFFVANIEHVTAIATLRGLWFFSPVMPGWSTLHATRATVTLVPITVGAALGIYRAWHHDRALLVLWGTPLAMIVLTAMGIWVAGWRNFLGPAVVVYALFTGYYVENEVVPRLENKVIPRLRSLRARIAGSR